VKQGVNSCRVSLGLPLVNTASSEDSAPGGQSEEERTISGSQVPIFATEEGEPQAAVRSCFAEQVYKLVSLPDIFRCILLLISSKYLFSHEQL